MRFSRRNRRLLSKSTNLAKLHKFRRNFFSNGSPGRTRGKIRKNGAAAGKTGRSAGWGPRPPPFLEKR